MGESNFEANRARGAEVSLLEIIRLLISKIHWLIIFGILGCVCVFLATKFFVTPQYQSYITLYIYNNASSQTSNGAIDNSDLQAAQNLASTYTHIIKSNSMLDDVSKTLEQQGTLVNRGQLSNAVAAEIVKSSQFLKIIVTTDDKELSYKIAKAFELIAPTNIPKTIKAGVVTVIDKAEVPSRPSSPNIFLFSALGFVSGVMFTALFWIIRTLLDTTIYISDDIKDISDVTVLGQIFELDVDNKKNEKQWSVVEGGFIYANRKNS